MKSGEKVIGLELLSAFSGVLIAAQSKVNGALSVKMGDSLEAAIVSFSTGLLFVTLMHLHTDKIINQIAIVVSFLRLKTVYLLLKPLLFFLISWVFM